TLTVTVSAEDIPAPGLLGFGFTLFFDSSVFTAAVPVIDSFWTGPTDVALGTGSAGATGSLGSGPTGPSGFGILLATIELTVVGAATTTQLSLGHFLGSGENLLTDGVIFDDGSIPGFLSTTTDLTVPEPQMIGLGLLACLGFHTRRSWRGSAARG
ncbi:MAG: hypothetical protein GY946_15015, partial [bacterium]|nr:hypothetical protein [bacterium]